MRQFVLIWSTMAILLTFQSCGSDMSKTDLIEKKLYGNVKSVAEYYYSVEKNAEGDLKYTPTTFASKEGGKVDFIEYNFHKNGMLDKYIYTLYDTYLRTNRHIYDERGRLKCIEHFGTGQSYNTTFVYDEKGRVSQKNTPDDKIIYTYNSKGCLMKGESAEFVIDREGNTVESRYKAYTLRSKYDDNGNEVECECIVNPNYVETHVGYKAKMEYDEYHNLVKEEIWYDDGYKRRVLQYVFDEHNNWIERTTYWFDADKQSLIPGLYTKRYIKYYEEKMSMTNETQGASDSHLVNLITEAYENAVPYVEVLYLPEVSNYIERWYSRAYYDLMLRYTSEDAILTRVSGEYYEGKTWISEGFGSTFRFYPDRSSINVELYLHGFRAEKDGTLSIYPWKKTYYENDFGEQDEDSPYLYMVEAFDRYSGLKSDIEIRIDGIGMKFILRDSWTKFHYGATVRVKAVDEAEVLELPVKEYKGMLYLTWNDDEIYRLLDLWSRKSTIMSIVDIDVLDETHRYIKEFDCIERTKLAISSLVEN